MTKKAIAYVSDIVIGWTGEVIRRDAQKAAIAKYAAENDIEIAATFEDEAYSEDVIPRSGIQRLLAYDEPYDLVLVERVWSLSRMWAHLEPFLKEMQRRERKVESAMCLWDCTSQRARWYFRPGSRPFAAGQQAAVVECAVPVPQKARVSAPPKLNFVQLRRRLAHA